MQIITIGRQVGSGGRIIGKRLAERLGYEFMDKDLLKKAAEASGIRSEFFEKTDECNSWWQSLVTENMLSGEHLFQWQAEAIEKLANDETKKGLVIMGRCADYVLRDKENRFDVFISAKKKDRIDRVMEYSNISAAEASKRIETMEKKRADYYNFYTGKTWGEPLSYHMCLNSSYFSLDECVELIIKALR